MESHRYYGTLILEGGIRVNFDMDFEHTEDVTNWLLTIYCGDFPKEEMIWITEEGTNIDFYIPKSKILAYSIKYLRETKD